MPSGVARRWLPRSSRPARSAGFTLVELLVVIFIILLLSAVALPVVMPAFNHREVSAAGRTLQGAIVGARDRAIHLGQPAGIRLLPDPTFPITWNPNTGTINPNTILAYNRIIPIESAPEYQEGSCTPLVLGSSGTTAALGAMGIPLVVPSQILANYSFALILMESPFDPKQAGFPPNPPTSWFWNIRVGDKVQLNNAGPWYTVVGPMAIQPSAGSNSELFVNVGPPGPIGNSQIPVPTIGGQPVEFLVLVNGVDDNKNGWIDEGWDGVDNNGNGQVDDPTEWNPAYGGEQESWLGSVATQTEINLPYTIRRRPAPSQNAREVALPSSMVIDATTWNNPAPERSRLPVNPYTGYVDIVINPDGTVVPTTVYSTPSSFGMTGAFFHFWLAERQDLADMNPNSSAAPFLPVAKPGGTVSGLPAGWSGYLKGEYTLLSLSTRSGNILVNQAPPFYFDSAIGYNSQSGTYNANYPFIQAEQGVNGGP